MDYSKGKIYKIFNTANDLLYVGSTTQDTVQKRFVKHKTASNKNMSTKLYQAMNEIGRDCFFVELLEEFSCKSRQELLAREGYWIKKLDTYNNGYNKQVPGRSQKEYKEINKERYAEFYKSYYETNKSELANYKKEWYENNKEKVIESKKIYAQNNVEKVRQWKKKYEDKIKLQKNIKKLFQELPYA